jgi:hybrid polyketide synthase/nonribosomal peptide synthetase ACE1
MAKRVNNIAAALLAHHMKPGNRVAVYQKPTSDWICSLLGILRIGAVYVPLDLCNPVQRLAVIVHTAQLTAILVDDMTAARVPGLYPGAAEIINVSSISAEENSPLVQLRAKSDDAAVVLFTSGSTGIPKGIVLRHDSLVKEIEGYVRQLNIGRETVLQQSAFSFDFSMDQIFTALSMGGTLVIVPEHKRGDSVEITKIMHEEGVTYTKATPSEYLSWIQFGGPGLRMATSWKFAFGGGELLTRNLVEGFKNLGHPCVRLYNSYGPAEATIATTKIEVPFRNVETGHDDRIPVGKILPNYSVYILDSKLNPLPVGFPGEIFIGGPGPAIGYLNNNTLTSGRFLTNKFATLEGQARGWTTMYRTGDVGRLREDGTLLFDSRLDGDTQIKLRGIRIDLLDIEATIVSASNGTIVDAAVSLQSEAQFLVAHVVFSKRSQPRDPTTYLARLLLQLPLPQYMRPAIAIELESMPLNTHNKKDRLAIGNLPLPQQDRLPSERTELSATENRLKQIWVDILSWEVAKHFVIRQDTDFFSIGGNSLLLVKLQFIIREVFHVALPLLELFEATTLGKMAARIDLTTTVNSIDWVKETAIDRSDFANGTLWENGHPTKPSKKVVLLTGATGYLGSYILRKLAEDNSVAEIHCVAIRQDSGESARPLKVASDKISIHMGDLTAPRLGLSEATAYLLAKQVDVIIHLGAKRSFWDSYHQLKGVNFDSTKELVRLAYSRKIPIHFTSSSGVLHLGSLESSNGTTSANSSEFSQPPVNGSNGYVASKWASETYLRNATRELGVPVFIHRFIPSKRLNEMSSHMPLLDNLLRLAQALGALPDAAGWKGYFDLMPSEELALRICQSALGSTEKTRQETTANKPFFVHHQSDIKLDSNEVFRFIEGHADRSLVEMERIHPLKWIGRIKTLGFGYLFASHDVSISTSQGNSLVNRR